VEGEELKVAGSVSAIGEGYSSQESIAKRGAKLHQWFQEFFFSKYHPTLGISLMNNFTIMAEPFCLILKFVDHQKEA
jgi:hypothetical protein